MTNKGFEKSISIIAYAVISNTMPVTEANIERESARIERMLQYHYKPVIDMHWFDFTAKFLTENFKEIVFGKKYSSSYLFDVPEPEECSSQN